MLPIRTATAIGALCVCALCLPSTAGAALVTYFNFNDYAGGLGPISSSSGSGTITIGGQTTTPVAASFEGTTVNGYGGAPAGNALSVGSNQTNDAWVTIAFNSLGYDNLGLSFAAKGSNSTYDLAGIQYSINGIDFFDAVPPIAFDPSAQGTWTTTGPVDLSSVTALNNAATAYLRLMLAGANVPPNQQLFIDNLQINGSSTPEAPAVAMMGAALLLFGGAAYRRRRARAGQNVPAQMLAG